MITSAEIRARFLEFFRQRGHTIVASSSLVPANDPTLLFVNAGMVQFKDVFLGLEQRPYHRATTSQKCMRISGKHNDLEEVGPSPRHHTLFEMLGNFSFGDYFKADAIDFAWTFLTEELGLDRDRLYVTVYEDDDEAYDLWKKRAQLPDGRIVRMGKKTNFWEMGDTGPCGPCSEIHFDRGPAACSCGRGDDCALANDDCDRWMELWNLVFMQYEQRGDSAMTPLPRPSIDTGMGLERITSVLQGADNNYDTDLFLPIMARTQELLGHDDAARRANLTAYRVIADHSRAITFLIAEGVVPGNEGRSYPLRLILRRAARFGRRLGFEGPFLAEMARVVIDTMGGHYAELRERRDFICEAITQEEERFLTTLAAGTQRLEALAAQLRADGATELPGEEAFRLYDTYGFPFELTRDAAAELGLTVDEPGFQAAMAAQRERARSVQRFAFGADSNLYRALDLPKTEFLGYDTCQAESRILALVRDGESVDAAEAGEAVDIVLAATPFYGESGGQVGDIGKFVAANGAAAVRDTYRPVPDVFVHRAEVTSGRLAVGDTVDAAVDVERRLDIARNHTATHLLHRALRQVLGEHAAQAGSLVSPERLRFDFTHLSALTADELDRVAAIVNQAVRDDRPVSTRVTAYDDAVKSGAIALFGEKYGDQVRVVSVEGFSTELCGGTHLQRTGQIGFLVILGETSVGSGLRRIEALTGRGAEAYLRERLGLLQQIGGALTARPGEELERIAALQEQLREQRRSLADLQRQLAAGNVESLLEKAVDVAGATVLAARADVADVDGLRELVDRFRDRLGSAVVALGAVIGERPILVVGLTPDLVKSGLSAGRLAGDAARKMGGGGGGRPDMAQAGGKDAARLEEALSTVVELVRQQRS